MISSLNIKNYAIIEELKIDFSDKLTIITGETGAGKSILLGALGLIMGKRADTKILYHDDKKCVVEAHFAVAKYDLKEFFDQNDIDYDDEVVIRRELTPSGKSRAFINDTPVKLKTLQALSSSLIDLHQQFDNLDIHNVSFQMRMIDALADNGNVLIKYQGLFKSFQKDQKRLTELKEQNDSSAREIDFLNFQLSELNEADLVEGEQAELESEQGSLTNAEDIKRHVGAAFQQLSENENAIIGQLQNIALNINSITKYHTKLPKIAERYRGIILELQEIAGEFESIAEETEYNQERINEVQSRLDLIYKLEQKYNAKELSQLLVIKEDLQTKLNAFGDLSHEIEALEIKLNKQEGQLAKIAKDLTKRRKKVVSGFESDVHKLLKQLSMEHALIKVEVQELPALNNTGKDEVHFLFAPNKGSKFLPIKDVASGGELSRLTLCTKSLVADAIPLPTLIFDEIDTGISGDVALKMGNILHHLADRHQVACITHSPQISVKADAHYFVFKKVIDDRTYTKVKLLTPGERVRAVATMLSGSPPSNSAIENAKELLGMQE